VRTAHAGDPGRGVRAVAARLGAIALCTLAALVAAQDALRLEWMPDPAARDGAPAGWQPLTFPKIPRHTQYRLVEHEGGWVVEARADASASGLIHRLQLDPTTRPLLRWRWRVDALVPGGDVTRKSGDDYAARVYITFAYDPKRASLGQRIRYEAARLIYGEYPPHSGLNYIWDGKAAAGSIVPNAYTDRVRMIVVQSGAVQLAQWLAYERDIVQDYRAAFGADPPAISGIAIMTDADDTGQSALAYYGAISLHSRP
jgi:hypothetical protein